VVNGDCVLASCSKKEKCPLGAECITIAGGVSYCACHKGKKPKPDGSCEGKKKTIGIKFFLIKFEIWFNFLCFLLQMWMNVKKEAIVVMEQNV
jgi:hypothetical protein